MEIKERKLKGVFEIILQPHKDDRGFFMRTYDESFFKEWGIERHWVQENHSRSEKKGIIRGLHFQFPPYAETKLVRCIKGAVFDVFVDLRKDSPTFGKWDSITLSEDNYKCILIPRGFAHGFCTMTDISEILYKHDNHYNSDHEGGIIWSDKDIDVKWPAKNPLLSERDQKFRTLKEFVKDYHGIEI